MILLKLMSAAINRMDQCNSWSVLGYSLLNTLAAVVSVSSFSDDTGEGIHF